ATGKPALARRNGVGVVHFSNHESTRIREFVHTETVSQKPVLSTFWRDSHLDHVEQFTGFLDLLAQWWPVRIIEVKSGVAVTKVSLSQRAGEGSHDRNQIRSAVIQFIYEMNEAVGLD